MANPTQIAVISVTALCLISLLPGTAAAHAGPSSQEFYVEGDVFCEVCRLNFINKLSERMSGAKVKLQCHGEGKGNITYTVEGETDSQGHYRLKVEDDHQEEECAVTLVKSSRTDCDEIPDEGLGTMPSSRVTLTKKNGLHDDVRKANPLGFLKKEALPECAELKKDLQDPENDDQPNHP